MGLASISAGVQRAGGSRRHPGAALDEALELRAASIEGGASGEALGMGTLLKKSLKDIESVCLESNLATTDKIAISLLCRPYYDPTKPAYMSLSYLLTAVFHSLNSSVTYNNTCRVKKPLRIM